MLSTRSSCTHRNADSPSYRLLCSHTNTNSPLETCQTLRHHRTIQNKFYSRKWQRYWWSSIRIHCIVSSLTCWSSGHRCWKHHILTPWLHRTVHVPVVLAIRFGSEERWDCPFLCRLPEIKCSHHQRFLSTTSPRWYFWSNLWIQLFHEIGLQERLLPSTVGAARSSENRIFDPW